MENRIGTYHKPNRTGRAWYVLLHGERPNDGDKATIIRRDGVKNEVIVSDAVPQGDSWVCKFKYVGGDSYHAAAKQVAVAVDASAFVGDANTERIKEAQETVEIDISGALEVARSALAQDGQAILAKIESRVTESLKTAMERVTGRVEYVNAEKQVIDCGRQHKNFAELMEYVQLGLNVWLPGPAGSGKTTAAELVAKYLGLTYRHSGKVLMEHALLGYMDAQGHYVPTEFYYAYKDGGLFLLDEADGSEAKALLALNMALDGHEMAFPCGIVKKHPNFRCIAAANTFGLGADADYVGRNQQDKAFLNRFITLVWPYDEEFETHLSGNPAWAHRVQSLRAKAKARGLKVLITPRATLYGALMLKHGIPQERVEQVTVRQAMTEEQWLSISREGY